VVHRGDTVVVTVSSAGATFAQLIIIGEDPIGFSQVLTKPPYRFSIHIPSHTTPGLYTLTASGAISPGNGVDSDPISIDVEPSEQPTSLTVEPTVLVINVGERTGMRVIGKYKDGSVLDLTESTQTRYISQNTKIATVSKDGFVTGVAVGSTNIVIDGRIKLQVIVQRE